MPSNDGEGERADGGVETVDFDSLEDDDLPEWATEEASVPATEPTHPPEPTDASETEPDDPTPERDEGADEPVDAATAVNFANVETGASASVSVGWSRTEADYGDTGGTSIDPDLDDVDPSALLDEIDDGEFPRPGATDTDTVSTARADAPPATTGGGLTPDDPAVAFGLGAVVMLVAAIIYVLLSAALPPAAAGLTIATMLVVASVVGLVYVVDQRY